MHQNPPDKEIRRILTSVGTVAMAGAERILAREIDANAHRDLLDQLAREI